MKGSTPALFVCAFATWALAAPVATVQKTPNIAESNHTQQTTKQTDFLSRTALFLSTLTPSRISIEKHNNVVVAEDGQRVQLPENLAGAKSWETPHVLAFLTSLARPKKQSPFPESSIIREETRGNMMDAEPQETIVELETKAERESWTYLPYVSQDKVLRFRCVRKAADTMMIALPVAATAMILMAILSRALRRRVCVLRTLKTLKKGEIHLDDKEMAFPNQSSRQKHMPATYTSVYSDDGVKS
ncbi:hypothetical protein F5Y00DRAFT_113569 [Daldinia vernicosa]|uniref:uncharacterized protein n=1 Tax=Daldinia vernicosa TaxID=114800 RepID=UPI00200735ED|nr:uncharacterized protein F5Y00DRAFT_113569 [Daldinia vernicosa]KAI0847646.1 hypothetical protein F5Y00DRAFT_113569 [Daldinia vernicosa]